MTQERMFSEGEQAEARTARESWEAKEYDRCHDALQKLKQAKQEGNARVLANNALVFYNKSGKENRIHELKNQLNKVLYCFVVLKTGLKILKLRIG